MPAGETRDRIVKAAAELFAGAGYDAVTMRRIGAQAGVDNSSIYKHFPGKAELAAAAVDLAAERALQRVQPHLEARTPRLEDIVAACVALCDFFSQRPDDARLLLAWLAARPEEGGLRHVDPARERERPPARLLWALGEWLARARRAGAIRRVAVVEAALHLVGIVLLPAATADALPLAGGDDADPELARRARVREVAATVRGALQPEPTAHA